MFECFKSKPVKPEVSRPSKPVETVGPLNNVPFAFIVGHNSSSKGATNYLKESEFVFNSRIARKAQVKLESIGIASAILFRPAGRSYSSQVRDVCKQVKRIDARFGLCMHFNDASSSKATGCEVLVRDTYQPEDENFADFLTDLMNERLGFVERHKDGVKVVGKGHNGEGMLSALAKAGCLSVLIEPCFAKDKKNAKKIFENEDAYVSILVEAIRELVTGKLK